ncbi:MAG TPA: AtpZ/AtpI family protein [Candidatus Angelobacter sp.]|nr:AtpZ/AtpI family protein [Candidatus Angelobacter sp.]
MRWLAITDCEAISGKMISMADKQRDWKKGWVQAEKMIELGITLPVATVLGWLIGDFLDKKFHTSWIAIVGLMIGVAAGLIRFIQRALVISAEDSKQDDEHGK